MLVFSLFKFCLEISLSPWVSLNTALIISLLLEQLHLERTDVAAALRRFSRSGFGWEGIPGNLIAFICSVTGGWKILSAFFLWLPPGSGFLMHAVLYCQHLRISDLN